MKKKVIKETVQLLPNSWEWVCPKCNGFNETETDTDSIPKKVKCGGCDYVAKVEPNRVHVILEGITLESIWYKKSSAMRHANILRKRCPIISTTWFQVQKRFIR